MKTKSQTHCIDGTQRLFGVQEGLEKVFQIPPTTFVLSSLALARVMAASTQAKLAKEAFY
jgi:hypothetical protein